MKISNIVIAETAKLSVQFSPSGAFIKKTSIVNLKKGLNEVIFDCLAYDINATMMYAQAIGAEVISSIIEPSDKFKSKTARIMKEHREIRLREIEVSDNCYCIDQEHNLLYSNSNIVAGGDVEKLEKFRDFYINRITQLCTRKTPLVLEQEELRKKLQELSSQFSNNKMQKMRLILSVAEDKAREITINYYTNQARWTPEYEVFSEGAEGNIKISLKANVANNSGEDFANAEVMFYTFNPQSGGTVNRFSPDYIPKEVAQYQNQRQLMRAMPTAANCMMLDSCCEEGVGGAEMSDGENGRIFLYNQRVTVNDGVDGLILSLTSKFEDAQYKYECMSFGDSRVYLTAEFETSLIVKETMAATYLDGKYCGNKVVGVNTEGKVSLSFGAVDSVMVVRELIKDFTSKKLLGAQKKESGYIVKVLNSKTCPITLQLTERIPVSTNKAVTVTSEIGKSGKLNAENGRVDFVLELLPGKEETVTVKYAVTT